MKEAGDRLQFARAAAGFKSARSAAVAFGWPLSTYNSHERAGYPGARNFTVEDARKYGSVFGVSAAWLLTGEGSPPDKAPPENARLANKSRPDSKVATPLPRREADILQTFPLPHFSGRRLPIFGVAVGGEDGRFEFNGEMLDTVVCPPGLENVPDAYGVWVSGESMYPRFKAGETCLVHPKLPPKRGDDIIVQLYPDNEEESPYGFIKEFIAWTPTRLIVRQFNPPKEIEFERSEVKSVHVIIGMIR